MAITAKVADIIDNRTVAISAGRDKGVELDMRFKIFSKEPLVVTDPDTGDVLGTTDREKFRVKVTQVFEKFCIAETYETETTNTGGTYNVGFSSLNKMFESPKLVKKYKTFEIDKQDRQPISADQASVSVGDRAVQFYIPKATVTFN